MEQALGQLHGLLPDLTTEIVKIFAQGDTVAAYIVFEGTHEGIFGGAQPTHRRVRFIAFDMHRVADGKVVESWHLEDNLSLLVQIGVVSPSSA